MKTHWLFTLYMCFILSACTSNPEPTSQPPPTTHQPPPTAPAGDAPSYPAPNQPAVPAPTATYTSNGYPGFWTPLPSATTVPLCSTNFSMLPNTIESNTPSLTFSEPSITHSSESALYVYEWLPDSERILIGQTHYEGQTQHTVETYSIIDNKSQLYAESPLPLIPTWHPIHEGVVYMGFLSNVGNVDNRGIWFSDGDTTPPELLLSGALSPRFSITPQGLLSYFSSPNNHPLHLIDVSTKQESSTLIAPTSWRSTLFSNPEAYNPNYSPLGFRSSWHPAGEKVIIYQYPTTFLYDITSNQICELDIGHITSQNPTATLRALWSPNGHYLALKTVSTQGEWQTSPKGTIILDFETQTYREIQLAEKQFIDEFVWSPTSQHLAIIGSVEQAETTSNTSLFLIDLAEGTHKRALPDYLFGGGTYLNLAWSPNNNHLALVCPLITENSQKSQLCVVDLTTP